MQLGSEAAAKIDLKAFQERRRERALEGPRQREFCMRCRQPLFGCFCAEIRSFDPKMTFAILIHPIEVKRRIATGRMSHLMLENSVLIQGQDYSHDRQVRGLIEDPRNHCVILYPGVKSVNLSGLSFDERAAQVGLPEGKRLVVFVIDGTWATARKMMRQSQVLHGLPRFCFTPTEPSQFRVRKQPAPECVSTIEAIHQTLELLAPAVGFDLEPRDHDRLLDVFDGMVERQLDCVARFKKRDDASTYRRET